jgi:regulation of enolase protein 1 (concanavalin A-like superfamily)
VSANVVLVSGAAPEWVRLTRRGNVIEGFTSTDGTGWTSIGAIAIDMGPTINAGLAVTSHNSATEATAVFDDVSLTP